jgi:hypothetical protein
VEAPLERRMNGERRAFAPWRALLPGSAAACYGAGAVENTLPDATRAAFPSSARPELERREADSRKPILDPRDGDAEDDASSPKQKSQLARMFLCAPERA